MIDSRLFPNPLDFKSTLRDIILEQFHFTIISKNNQWEEQNIQYITLSGGTKTTMPGYGVYQVTKDECEKYVLDALKISSRLIDTAQSNRNKETTGKRRSKRG